MLLKTQLEEIRAKSDININIQDGCGSTALHIITKEIRRRSGELIW